MKNSQYKWIAHRGERNGATVGMGFLTKAEAVEFAKRENRRHASGYVVAKAADVKNPQFN